MTAPLLHLDGVSHRYRRSRGVRGDLGVRPSGVHDVDLRVAVGERVGLVGASGAGKTTLAHLATGLLTPDAGRVLLGGADRRSLDRRVVGGRVHLVSQDPYTSLAPHGRVRWLVAEPLLVRQRSRSVGARVRAALAEVGLTPVERFLDRFPHELSGGQRQRVALARALVARPALVVADEPTQMLDVLARRELLDLIDHIGAATAWLYITHDLALAGQLCDRLVVVHDGRVVEEGPTEAVLTAPTSEPARALVDAVRLLSR